MHIEFDNSARLCRNVYYFEYKGIRYKLIQNNFLKWRDVLITIIDHQNDEKSINNAYRCASEFLCALSWQNNSKISMSYAGGLGLSKKVLLRNTKSTFHNICPQVPLSAYRKNIYDICEIPSIETDDQKEALLLLREAEHSNNLYLSFLFYWQILETGNNGAIGWINKVVRKKNNYNKLLVSNDDIKHLPLNGRDLGNYLYDDCRNAIAHIKRNDPGKVKLSLDSHNDSIRIAKSTAMVRKFARFYIIDKLKLQKKLFLVRNNETGFPVFVDENNKLKHKLPLAYKRLPIDIIRRKELTPEVLI